MQGQWRSLLEQDPDQAIEALAGLSVHARARARALVTLAERHAVGGGQLVDSGLQAFQEQERFSFDHRFLRHHQELLHPSRRRRSLRILLLAVRNLELPRPQDGSGPQASTGQQDPWSGWHSGLLGQDGR